MSDSSEINLTTFNDILLIHKINSIFIIKMMLVVIEKELDISPSSFIV